MVGNYLVYRQTDGRTDGRKDGRTGGQAGGRAGMRAVERTDINKTICLVFFEGGGIKKIMRRSRYNLIGII